MGSLVSQVLEALFIKLPRYLWQITTHKRPGPVASTKARARAVRAKVEPSFPMVGGIGLALLLPPLMALLQVSATVILCGIFPWRKVQWWLVIAAFVGCMLLTNEVEGTGWTPVFRSIANLFK